MVAGSGGNGGRVVVVGAAVVVVRGGRTGPGSVLGGMARAGSIASMRAVDRRMTARMATVRLIGHISVDL